MITLLIVYIIGFFLILTFLTMLWSETGTSKSIPFHKLVLFALLWPVSIWFIKMIKK